MSEHTAPTEGSTDDLAKIGFEPDDVPVAALFKMSVGLTVVVVAMVVGTYFYFNHTVEAELLEKGYGSTEPVPAEQHKR